MTLQKKKHEMNSDSKKLINLNKVCTVRNKYSAELFEEPFKAPNTERAHYQSNEAYIDTAKNVDLVK